MIRILRENHEAKVDQEAVQEVAVHLHVLDPEVALVDLEVVLDVPEASLLNVLAADPAHVQEVLVDHIAQEADLVVLEVNHVQVDREVVQGVQVDLISLKVDPLDLEVVHVALVLEVARLVVLEADRIGLEVDPVGQEVDPNVLQVDRVVALEVVVVLVVLEVVPTDQEVEVDPTSLVPLPLQVIVDQTVNNSLIVIY